MLNTSVNRTAGAITAALFLKQFVDEKVQWMHIDIAGTALSTDKKRGATGFGIATLVEWVLKNSSQIYRYRPPDVYAWVTGYTSKESLRRLNGMRKEKALQILWI